jgi:hypothetical protein
VTGLQRDAYLDMPPMSSPIGGREGREGGGAKDDDITPPRSHHYASLAQSVTKLNLVDVTRPNKR